MNPFWMYILNFSPIPVGILVFCMMRLIRASNRKIKIYCRPVHTEGRPQETVIAGATHAIVHSDAGKRNIAIHNFALDELITRGLLKRNHEYSSLAILSELAVLDMRNFVLLSAHLKEANGGRLHVFVSGMDELIGEVLGFGRTSGLLLAFLLDYKLEVTLLVL